MNTLQIRRMLGFGWFYSLAFATAAVVVSTDADIGGLKSALAYSNLPTVVAVSIPVVLMAVPSFLLFLRQRWCLGSIAALVLGVIFWGMLKVWQAPLSISNRELLTLLPRLVMLLGGWTILVSLPAALFLGARGNRNR